MNKATVEVTFSIDEPGLPPLIYENLQRHQKKFWDVVEHFLQMGVTPTPRVVNEALGKKKRTSWNGPLCKIRTQLLTQYGYELVHHVRGIGGGTWRWEKVNNGT